MKTTIICIIFHKRQIMQKQSFGCSWWKWPKNQLKIQKYETFTKFWSFLQPLIEMNSLLPILATLDFCHPSPNELGHCALTNFSPRPSGGARQYPRSGCFLVFYRHLYFVFGSASIWKITNFKKGKNFGSFLDLFELPNWRN